MSGPEPAPAGAGAAGAEARPPVVLVHGVGLDRTMWAGVAARLSRRRVCVAPDLPGHGSAPAPPGGATLAAFARAVGRAAEEAAARGPGAPPDIVGFSMGAMAAWRFALDRPGGIGRLVLMNAVFLRDDAQRAGVRARLALAEREGPAAIAGAAVARWFTPGFRARRPAAVEAARRRLAANDPAAYAAAYRVFAEADAELAPLAGRIACPTLVLTGARDANATPEMARALAAAIPRGEAAVLDGLAHGAPIEAPDRVADVLESWLDRRTDRSRAP